VGLAAGLEAAHGSLALLVSGDRPWLSPAVLAELLLWLGGDAGEASLEGVALTNGGLLRPLPAALRVATVRPIVATQLERGDPSLLGLFGHLRMGTLEPARWQGLDPAGATLRDVDTPDDPRRS
jgi:CTP:molybdopterin cytidylyltransferase MocA